MADANPTTKRCSCCGADLPRASFTRRSKSKDGLSPSCKACRKKIEARSKAADPERFLQRRRGYYHQTKAANPALLRTYARAFRLRHQEKVRAEDRVRRKADPERAKAVNLLNKARRRGAEGRHSLADLDEIAVGQKGRCAYCRAALKDGRHVDHIVPLAKRGSNDRKNIQLLCAPCNLRKSAKDPLDFARELGFLM